MLQRILRIPLLRRSIPPAGSLIRPAVVVLGSHFSTTRRPLQELEAEPNTAGVPLPPVPETAQKSTAPSETLRLLPLLRAQPKHYITIHIHAFPFLVTVGDKVTLPFRLKGVKIGQTLRLTHASLLGSRDYTLKGHPYIDEQLFECRATVVEETAEPMRTKEKTKRRQRRVKKVKSKHVYTVLRIKELVLKDPAQEV